MSVGTGWLFWDWPGSRPPVGTAGTGEIEPNPAQMTSRCVGPPWPKTIFSICTFSELIAMSIMCPTRVDTCTYFGFVSMYILQEIKDSSTTLNIQALKHAQPVFRLPKSTYPSSWFDVWCTSYKMYIEIHQRVHLDRVDAPTPSPK